MQGKSRIDERKKQARAENAFHDKLMRVFPFPHQQEQENVAK